MDGRESRADDVRAPISVLPGNGAVIDAKRQSRELQGFHAVPQRPRPSLDRAGLGGCDPSIESGACVSQREAEHIGPIERRGWSNGTAGCLCYSMVQLFVMVYASQQ